MARARIVLDGKPVWAVVDGEDLAVGSQRIPFATAQFLPPVEAPSKIIAIHLNYRSRVEEYGIRLPESPSYFLKPSSSLSTHGSAVARPRGCRFLNYEGEIALVIGRRCRGVGLTEAEQSIAGLTIANDWGLHDFRHADRGSMLRVKGLDGYCPLGPVLVEPHEVDLAQLTLTTYRNGQVVQHARVADDLLFAFDYLIADLSRLITLEPGDVILTGTPANSRPVEPGDVVEVEVSGIGRLQNTVIETDVDFAVAGVRPRVTWETLHVALAIPEAEAQRRVHG
jgi:5-oxopent-3-ene-1,2,5-tricarboxylate decarboxylase/2-hydroxyhepta-2,4-diene-1,7-dioate isomerase